MTPASTNLLPLRLLCTLTSATLFVMGGYNVISRHYYGRNTRFGNEVWLDGAMAVSMGGVMLFLALVPLAVWFRKPVHAATWATFWTFASGALFLKVLYASN